MSESGKESSESRRRAEGAAEPHGAASESGIQSAESRTRAEGDPVAPRGVVGEDRKEPAEFLKHLQNEKLQTQTARTRYVTQKLAYATGLLALGSLKPGSADL